MYYYCISVIFFPMQSQSFKDCLKMIEISESEPPCFIGERTKPVFQGLRSGLVAGGSGAAEKRDNPFTFRRE